MSWLPWVLMPLLGGLIGWATNAVAVRMLFRPRKPRFGLHGLLPRRQPELARSVGTVVGTELVRLERLLEPLAQADLAPHLSPVIESVLDSKLEDLRALPLIGGLVSRERMGGLRDAIVREIVKHQPEIVAGLAALVTRHVDVAAIAERELAAFDLERLESVVRNVAASEFRAIEWWGAILGALIGVAQAGIAVWLSQAA